MIHCRKRRQVASCSDGDPSGAFACETRRTVSTTGWIAQSDELTSTFMSAAARIELAEAISSSSDRSRYPLATSRTSASAWREIWRIDAISSRARSGRTGTRRYVSSLLRVTADRLYPSRS